MQDGHAAIDHEALAILSAAEGPLSTVEVARRLKDAGHSDAEASRALLRLVSRRRADLTEDRRLRLHQPA